MEQKQAEETSITPSYPKLRVLSWNIAESRPSAMAPASWRKLTKTSQTNAPFALDPRLEPASSLHNASDEPASERIREEILSHDPDIIALQEVPYPQWSVKHFGSQYFVLGADKDDIDDNNNDNFNGFPPTRSHCGYVQLLIRKGLAKTIRPIIHPFPSLGERRNLPSVAAAISIPVLIPSSINRKQQDEKQEDFSPQDEYIDIQVIVSSSHLAPFRDNFTSRHQQMQSLAHAIYDHHNSSPSPSPSSSSSSSSMPLCIFMGDMNMRSFEDENFEFLSLDGPSTKHNNMMFVDAWKATGSNAKTQSTWDTNLNRYHGLDSARYQSRYDRIYVSSSSSTLMWSTEKENCNTDKKDNEATMPADVALKVEDFHLIGDKPLLNYGGRHHYLSDHFGIMATLGLITN